MPGYRLVGVDKNNLDTKYLCSLCGELLRDAVQTKCGHFYCKSCLEQCLENSTTPFNFCCAKDGKVLQKNQIFEDRFIRREILALMVFCTFKDEGCTWRGEVRHFEDHEATCEFMKVSCVYGACGSLVKRGDLVHHLTTECSCRPQKCRFCGKEISCNLMKKHLRTNHNYLHYEMDNLRDGVDDVLHVLENLRDEQCGLQYGQRDLRDGQRHLRDGVQNAMRQLQECLAGQGNLQNRQDDLQNAVRVVQETIAELIRSYDDQKMEGDFITDKLANLEDKLNKALLTFDGRAINGNAERTLALGSRESGSVEMQVENTQETPGRMERCLQPMVTRPTDHEVLLVESVRRLERRIESIEHTLALRDEKMRQLEEFSSSDGQYLWKISDYAHKRNDAVTGQQVSFYSPCFFTSRYGYKMRAQLYLNGDGMGRGTHISVFFVVMHGQYDALLRWPFRQKVTFMLLDQDNVEHVSEAFRPDPSSSSFQRPKREANIASGCPTFCSQAELNNHAYVRDDTMFLKIIVDTSDL